MKNDYLVSEADENGSFIPIPGLDNIFIYEENIHGFYGILAVSYTHLTLPTSDLV